MSFWSGEKFAANPSVVTGFSLDDVDANAYNLRMGNSYFRTADDLGGKEQKKTALSPGESFIIPAGQFAFLLTRETVNVPPNAMAFISMRTGIKFQGLINVSGFHVDPGYSGKLIYAVYNASPSPVQICEGDPIFKIWFADLDCTSDQRYLFRGVAQNDISNAVVRGMSKEILSLQNLTEKMRVLETGINSKLAEQKPTIDNLTFVWRTITLGVVATVLVAVLALAWPSLKTYGGEIADFISSHLQKR
jgi:dCTP deaminase